MQIISSASQFEYCLIPYYAYNVQNYVLLKIKMCL
jgi:hypothetical protein